MNISIMPSAAGLWTRRLMADGYCIIPHAIDARIIGRLDEELESDFLQTPFCRGGFYGERTKRFGRLLARSERAKLLVQHRLVLAIVNNVLEPWCDRIQLNLTQAIAIHPGALPQFPHRDQDMWRGEIGKAEYLVNVMWPFTQYCRENGATLIWPGSHGKRALSPDAQGQPVAIEATPGSAILFLGSTLHGAGGNETNEVRRGAIVSYCLGWLKPYENQWLAYPPAIARNFNPELAALVGYRQHRPNLGNFEGLCPSVLLGEGASAAAPAGATDALRPDQARLVAEFVASQGGPG